MIKSIIKTFLFIFFLKKLKFLKKQKIKKVFKDINFFFFFIRNKKNFFFVS